MRPAIRFVFLFGCIIIPAITHAAEAPSAQTHIDATQILRGHFTEARQMSAASAPLETSGHFTIAPAYGLIWGLEKPFPTSTIITQNGAAQDIGGMAVKLPVKNLGHLYNMVGGALAGNWGALENDYVITKSGTAQKWQMLLTPRPDAPHKISYSSITVSGGAFVENIAMMTPSGASDIFSFSDATLSPVPPTPQEARLYGLTGR